MSNKLKKVLKEEYDRLKKSFDKILKPKHQKNIPQPAYDPYRPRNRF